MADQSSDKVIIGPPTAWQREARMIAQFRPEWNSIQVTPLADGGRLIEIVVDDRVIHRARLDVEAAEHLARLLTEESP